MITKTLRHLLAGGVMCLLVGCAERRRTPEPHPEPLAERSPAPPAQPPPPESQCGHSGLPDCPLQAWMDARLNTAMSDGNFASLARSLRDLAEDPPPGFSSWRRWADQGAEAAERNDHAQVNTACTGCHNEHRDAYRRTIRGRTLRPSNN